jgi:hypothetical protein
VPLPYALITRTNYSICTFPRSHALWLGEDVIGRGRDWPVPTLQSLTNAMVVVKKLFSADFGVALLVHRKIKRASQNRNPPKTYAICSAINACASATTAGRPVSNTIMQANGGHPRKHKDEFVYNICKWLIIHTVLHVPTGTSLVSHVIACPSPRKVQYCNHG